MDDQTLKKEAGYKALKLIYPNLKFTKNQVTPQATAFAFKLLYKVDNGTRWSGAIFNLYGVYTSWSQLPKVFSKSVYDFLKNPNQAMMNRITLYFVASQHQRNLQYHLNDPENFPCPAFRK